MRKKGAVFLLLMLSAVTGHGATVKKTVVKVLPKVEIEGKFNEEKAILNYLKKEGYIQKSNMRKTTDKTMEEEVKEIEAEKNGVTYTLYLKADEASGIVVTVDTSVREEHNRVLSIEAATYARGIDINLYPREHISPDEIRTIGIKIADKIRGINPSPGKLTLIIYDVYDHSRILYKDNF